MSNKLKWVILAVVILGLGVGIKSFFFDQHRNGNHYTKVPHSEHNHEGHWTCSMHPQVMKNGPGKCPICGMDLVPVENTSVKKQNAGSERKIKYWVAPMDPKYRRDKPGKSPMGMDLVPVYEENEMHEAVPQLKLSKKAEMLASVQTSPVIREFGTLELRLVGKIMPDETRQKMITARVAGRLDKLWVNFTGQFVKKGSPMAQIYSPELVVAQKELLAAQRVGNNELLNSVKEKLRLWEVSSSQIQRILKSGRTRDHVELESPINGIVTKMMVSEGQYVKTGMSLFSVVDLSKLWVQLEVYESDLLKIKIGQKVTFRTQGFPGKSFQGKVSFIDPVINPMTRTAMVRVVVSNKKGLLKPDMLVDATIFIRVGRQNQILSASQTRNHLKPLLIPATAPLITGKRAVVYVKTPDQPGVYEGREIVLGLRVGNYYVVESGLSEGEYVVTKGNFKIDSAMQIMAKPSMMDQKNGGNNE